MNTPTTKTMTKMTWALLAAAAVAQAESTLAGRITDPSGSPVAESIVVVRGEHGLSARAVTDEHGAYRFEQLSAGEYTVRITKPGFTTRQYVVRLSGRGSATLDAQFAVAGSARTIQEGAPAPAALRFLLQEAVRPKWSHVQLLGQFTFTAPSAAADGRPSFWQQAAADAYREQPKLATVFATTTQAPAAIGYRFRF